MSKLVLTTLASVSMLLAVGCGNTDCDDAYERIRAKYIDCSLQPPTVDGFEECTDVQGDSLKNLADVVETATCANLRILSSAGGNANDSNPDTTPDAGN